MRCADKIGNVVGMQKPCGEGLAIHAVPESCGVIGNGGAEALTGVRIGWVLSPEMKTKIPSADVLQDYGRQHFMRCHGKAYEDSAGSETPCMYRDTLRGNREALHLTFIDCIRARVANPKGVRPW